MVLTAQAEWLQRPPPNMCNDNQTSKGGQHFGGTTTTTGRPLLQQKFVHIVVEMVISNVNVAPNVVNNINNHNHVNNNMVGIQEHTSNNLTPQSLDNMV
jgi:hypothetical protein